MLKCLFITIFLRYCKYLTKSLTLPGSEEERASTFLFSSSKSSAVKKVETCNAYKIKKLKSKSVTAMATKPFVFPTTMSSSLRHDCPFYVKH